MIALIALAAMTPAGELAPKIVGVSMFKNGFALVTREASVEETGTYTMTDLPNAAYGTYWIMASPGVMLKSVRATNAMKDHDYDLGTLDQILAANVGKTLTLDVEGQGLFIGKLISVSGEIALIKRDTGIVVVRNALVRRIESKGELVYKSKVKQASRVLKIDLTAPHGGTLMTISLEQGLSWVPAYSVDITDPKELTLTARATVVNDLGDFGPLEAKFVTGFPNMAFAGYPEPLFQSGLVARDVNGVTFGGQGGGAGGFATQNAAKDMAEVAPTPTENFAGAGFQAEDLFFYRQSGVTMSRGDRAYYVLFSTKSAYEHIYTWDIPDSVQNNVEYRDQPGGLADVWHSLKFKNTAGMPLTTGAAVTYQKGELLGQDSINYTTAGVDTTLRITKALDVQADASEEEVSRDRNSMRYPNGIGYDLVTLKGTLVVKNLKKDAVHMKITKDITGEVSTADGSPVVTKTAKGLRDVNPTARLVWNPEVAPGDTLTLTYTYKLYVRD